MLNFSLYYFVVSDSCSENRAEDKSGTNLCSLIEEEKLWVEISKNNCLKIIYVKFRYSSLRNIIVTDQ